MLPPLQSWISTPPPLAQPAQRRDGRSGSPSKQTVGGVLPTDLISTCRKSGAQSRAPNRRQALFAHAARPASTRQTLMPRISLIHRAKVCRARRDRPESAGAAAADRATASSALARAHPGWMQRPRAAAGCDGLADRASGRVDTTPVRPPGGARRSCPDS